MKMNYIASVVISHCIDYFNRDEKIGTTYHPKEDVIILDAKVVARVIKHNGVLNSQVTRDEKTFFGEVLRHINNTGMDIFETMTKSHKYLVQEHNAFPRFALKFTRKHLIKHCGRKPKYVEEPKWQTQLSE